VLISEKTINNDSKEKLEKSKDMYKSRYLISQNVTFTQLCFLNFLIKISFLFDQTIIKTYKQIIN